MNKAFVAILCSALMLSACADLNNEGVGTVAGGIAGGILGSQIGGGSGRVVATGVGSLVGAFLGGRIGHSMDKQDQMQMKQALETAPTGKTVRWRNPDSGNHYAVKTTRTYYHHHQPCREYVTEAKIGGRTEQIYGKACRKADGSWKVVR